MTETPIYRESDQPAARQNTVSSMITAESSNGYSSWAVMKDGHRKHSRWIDSLCGWTLWGLPSVAGPLVLRLGQASKGIALLLRSTRVHANPNMSLE